MTKSSRSFWFSPNGVAAIAMIAAVLYFLLAEHRAHFIYALPYLILLLCPAMHLFMHHGHGTRTDEGDNGGAHQHKEGE